MLAVQIFGPRRLEVYWKCLDAFVGFYDTRFLSCLMRGCVITTTTGRVIIRYDFSYDRCMIRRLRQNFDLFWSVWVSTFRCVAILFANCAKNRFPTGWG
jgi:hypothetical protein